MFGWSSWINSANVLSSTVEKGIRHLKKKSAHFSLNLLICMSEARSTFASMLWVSLLGGGGLQFEAINGEPLSVIGMVTHLYFKM